MESRLGSGPVLLLLFLISVFSTAIILVVTALVFAMAWKMLRRFRDHESDRWSFW